MEESDGSIFYLDGNQDLQVSSLNPFEQQTLCIAVETQGRVSAYVNLYIEVCGNEQISLNPGYETYQANVIEFDETESTIINLSSLGYQFISNRTNCTVAGTKLVI